MRTKRSDHFTAAWSSLDARSATAGVAGGVNDGRPSARPDPFRDWYAQRAEFLAPIET